jgi:hypothetical protein
MLSESQIRYVLTATDPHGALVTLLHLSNVPVTKRLRQFILLSIWTLYCLTTAF